MVTKVRIRNSRCVGGGRWASPEKPLSSRYANNHYSRGEGVQTENSWNPRTGHPETPDAWEAPFATSERRFQTFAKAPLLIIDDFGLKPMAPPHDEDFHDLVSERYERTATIVTSNLDFTEWGDAFPNRLLGAATLDRLRHAAYRVILDGESYRTPKPLPKTPKKTLGKEGQKPLIHTPSETLKSPLLSGSIRPIMTGLIQLGRSLTMSRDLSAMVS